jgi:hypothetical protein
MILYEFFLLPAQFCYMYWKISNGAENLIFEALQILEVGLPQIPSLC